MKRGARARGSTTVGIVGLTYLRGDAALPQSAARRGHTARLRDPFATNMALLGRCTLVGREQSTQAGGRFLRGSSQLQIRTKLETPCCDWIERSICWRTGGLGTTVILWGDVKISSNGSFIHRSRTRTDPDPFGGAWRRGKATTGGGADAPIRNEQAGNFIRCRI